MNTKKTIIQLILHLFIFIVALTPLFYAGRTGETRPLFQEETPDTTDTPEDTIETAPSDSLDTPRTQPRTSILSRIPADTVSTSQDTLRKGRATRRPPASADVDPSVADTTVSPGDTTRTSTLAADTSGTGPSVADTTLSPEDTTGVPALGPDTTTVDLIPTDTTVTRPAEADTTAPSPADTMFGKTYMAYIGETMFTHKRRSPFPATYVYKYAGFEGDSTLRVDLTTAFMQQSYRSFFQFPIDGADTLALGPYDVWIDSVDSLSVTFELLGYTQLPEPEIPERVEEVAEAATPAETAPETLPQLDLKESPADAREYFSRGYIRGLKGSYAEAKQDLRTALDLDSTLFDARLALGWILTEEEDSTALDVLKTCLELKPDDANASFFLAYGLEKLGSPEEAVASYSRLTERDSSNARAFFQLAALYADGGDSLKQEASLEKSRSQNPDLDSTSAPPSLSDIPHEFWWTEQWPQLVHFEEPVLPDSALTDSLTCVARFKILVDEKGKPARVEVLDSCDHAGFNEAAEAAAWKCTFTPGKSNNKPVRVWVAVPFRIEWPKKEEPPAGAQPASDSMLAEQASVPDTGEVEPKLIGSVHPEYPQEAREDSIETTVLLNVLVGTDGSVAEVQFIRPDTSNQAFNEAAEAAARKCRFQPGLRDGKPDTMWTELPISFSLITSPQAPPPTPPRAEPSTRVDAERPRLPDEAQQKASALIQGTMLAQQGKYDEALDLIRGNLESEPRDENSQLLYGLMILGKETGKRMEEVTDLAGQPEAGVYWWVDTMPQIKELKEADYPEAAKASGAEGSVILYVLVDGKGAVERVTVVQPLEEPRLNEAAEQAARECTFTPGTLGGEPARVWTRLSFEFKP